MVQFLGVLLCPGTRVTRETRYVVAGLIWSDMFILLVVFDLIIFVTKPASLYTSTRHSKNFFVEFVANWTIKLDAVIVSFGMSMSGSSGTEKRHDVK